MPLSRVASKLLAYAHGELRGGQPAAARTTLGKVLALAPGNADALRLLGVAAQMCGDHDVAIDCFRKVIAVRPGDSGLYSGLGMALFEAGEADEALRCLRQACELAPNAAATWFNFGEALKQDARTDDARAALQRAVGVDATHLPARLSLARVHASLGQVDAAVREFREVLRRDPANARAWFGLSNLNTVRFSATDTAQLQRLFAAHALPAEARAHLGFALAKALEHRDDYLQAFDVLEAANRVQRGRVQWDRTRQHTLVESITREFSDWAPPVPVDPMLGREAILLVSIPRSGSTLAEQILASHAEVEGANEVTDLPDVIEEESKARRVRFPTWARVATAADWDRLGRAYLARTARWRARKPRFTDKNLVTWRFVGAALAMLPAARVVVVRRDPLETCLACYRQWFARGAEFTYDLDEMADCCIDFVRLTRFWLRAFPARVLDLEYEALVAQPEPVIRRLLEFCGLAFDPACLQPHLTARSVLSAPSAAEVREPIHAGTARAARYGDRLDHLRDRLRAAGLAFGDSAQGPEDDRPPHASPAA
jgi:tetratricopeptide (TPR) repeat protein